MKLQGRELLLQLVPLYDSARQLDALNAYAPSHWVPSVYILIPTFHFSPWQ
jgi:hypothetical protein